MTPERIAIGLDDRFRLLTGGPRNSIPRQQTLQSSVEWSRLVSLTTGITAGSFNGSIVMHKTK